MKKLVCFILVLGMASTVSAALPLVADPTMMADGVTAYSGMPASNMLDEDLGTEFAASNSGAAWVYGDTWASFDFGAATDIGGFTHIDRGGTASVNSAQLIFDDNADFSSPIHTVMIDHIGADSATTYKEFATVNAQYVKWEVTDVTNHSAMWVGGKEIDFHSASSGLQQMSKMVPSTIMSAHGGHPSGAYEVANLFDDDQNTEYAADWSGVEVPPAGCVVEMDFGSAITFEGLEHITRAGGAIVTASDMIFDDDADFSSPIQTVSLAHGSGYNYWDLPNLITAQYVKWNVTATSGQWIGGKEMAFYGVPEPATMMLLGLGGLALIRRKRA